MALPRWIGLFLLVGVAGVLGCVAASTGKHATDGNAPGIKDAGGGDERSKACDGKAIFTIEESYADGNPAHRREVVEDDDRELIDHGLTTFWYENGNKKLEIQYNCGLKHGPKQTWYQDGQRWSVGGHINGKDHGTWTVWFPDGTKSQEFTMDHGAWNGLYTNWHPNGKKKMEMEYVHGVRQGMMTLWDETGNILKQVEYVDGKAQPMPAQAATQP